MGADPLSAKATEPHTQIPVPVLLDDDRTQDLRARVREFLAAEKKSGGFVPAVNGWMSGWDRGFSQRLAAAGFIGLAIPRKYGGVGGTLIDRFVVNEELLAAGAPVAAHWFADRQVAPALLSVGTEEQRSKLLPRIAAGQLTFAIGMSEPDSGSDLASVAMRAHVQPDGSWRLTGTKIWTSGAHVADAILLLARSSPFDQQQRHAGLSQFIVDLASPGITVSPIRALDGSHHFNEVAFDDVSLPPSALLGQEGAGWQQVNAELAYERSGPERFLSTQVLLEQLVRPPDDPRTDETDAGRYAARVAALHHLSMSVAGTLARGEDATTAAGVAKILGTVTEGDIVETAALRLGQRAAQPLRQLVQQGLNTRPTYTLRGGTNEILRGVLAREVGLR